MPKAQLPAIVILLGGFLLAPVTVARAASTTATVSARLEPVPGIYRLSLVGHASEQRVELLLKACATGYCGYLITGEHTAALDELSFRGDTLRATVMTSAGRAQVELHLDDAGITGTMMIGRTSIAVVGERIS